MPKELRGLVALGLGERGRALAAIDDAFRERSGGVLYLPVEPLRTEKRFQAMLARLATGSD